MSQVDSDVKSGWNSPERQALAALVRDFTRTQIAPNLAGWEADEELPRWLHRSAGELGLLGLSYSDSVGGSGGDLRDVVVMTEGVLAAGGSGGVIAGLFTHGISIPHVVDAAQRRSAAGDSQGAAVLLDRIVRPTLAGDSITALGVTEPDGGSDVGAIRTTAAPLDEAGNSCHPESAARWRINGAKAYITSGARADVVVVAARTFGEGAAGVALFAVPTTLPGFTVVRRMAKMGWHCSDTAELSFTDLEVPAWSLLTPGPGLGFASLARHFAVERISLAVTAYATAQRCLDLTVEWTKQRTTFNRPLASRQVVRHNLVEMYTLIDVARTYTRALVRDLVEWNGQQQTPSAAPGNGPAGFVDASHHTPLDRSPDPTLLLRAALAKNNAVAACDAVVAKAVQLHGGYGFLRDAEVEMHYRDAKVLGIGGGATEVMTDLAAKLLGY